MTPLPAALSILPSKAPAVTRLPAAGSAVQTDSHPAFEAVRQRIAAPAKKERTAKDTAPKADQGGTHPDARPDAQPPVMQPPVMQPPPGNPVSIPVVLPASEQAATTTISGAISLPAGRVAQTQPGAALLTQPLSKDVAADPVRGNAADFAQDLLAALGGSSTSSSVMADRVTAPSDVAPVAAPLPPVDMTGDAWLEQLAQDIAATANADGKLSFRIVPPQLGRLDINIETRDAGIAVHMKAETREAHAIIAASQPRLEDALGAQGIRVSQTSVTSNGGGGNLPRPHFVPQKPVIEAVNDTEHEADAPTLGRAAGRFA